MYTHIGERGNQVTQYDRRFLSSMDNIKINNYHDNICLSIYIYIYTYVFKYTHILIYIYTHIGERGIQVTQYDRRFLSSMDNININNYHDIYVYIYIYIYIYI
jgi:hypothetical protein